MTMTMTMEMQALFLAKLKARSSFTSRHFIKKRSTQLCAKKIQYEERRSLTDPLFFDREWMFDTKRGIFIRVQNVVYQ